jgi:hypothetical protein
MANRGPRFYRILPNGQKQYVRPVAMSGLGDMEHLAVPNPDGSFGPATYPYDERLPEFNPANMGAGGGQVSTVTYGNPMPQAAPGPGANQSIKSAMATIPITSATVANIPIVNSNQNRNFLLVQNNSTATSPDTTPTFYITFDAPAQGGFGQQVAIPAGSGVFFDAVVPINAIFIAQGPFANGGSTVVIAGVIVQGIAVP